MATITPARETAFELFKKYNKSESLLKHALSVEGVMRYMARKNREDEEKWGIIGLINDLDYEMYPDQHCIMTEKILKENNWYSKNHQLNSIGREPSRRAECQ
jgi:predicted hydrolase (HD superfamily)